MSESQQQWKEWLKSVPDSQQSVLFETLRGRFSNGHAPQSPIKITRTPTEDLLPDTVPPYLDIFHLHDLYRSLAFKSNLLIKGPKGDGKTLSVVTYAHSIQCPIVIQESSEDTKKMDLMGSQTLIGDETIFTLGSIPTAIDVANEYGMCVLLVEEINALTPQVQKQLNASTDFRQQCSLPFLGKTYKLSKGNRIWVVGTMNPSVYGGTYDINEDLKSRFEEADLPYPQAGQEKQVVRLACQSSMGLKMPVPYKVLESGQSKELWHLDETIIDKVIRLAAETRQPGASGYALSTRDVVRVVETMAVLGVEKALQLALCKFEGDEDKTTMKKRLSSIFGPLDIKNYWS